VQDLRELFRYLQIRPDTEVTEIIRRIRADEDPQTVLRFIKDGDLLLEASATSPRSGDTSEMQKLDREALKNSSIIVPARPWTVIAGDGVVSNLISTFFSTCHYFVAVFVDKKCFLQDMRSRSTRTSEFCSPFLVNAICAWASVRCSESKHGHLDSDLLSRSIRRQAIQWKLYKGEAFEKHSTRRLRSSLI
jgi:hypothetical protein